MKVRDLKLIVGVELLKIRRTRLTRIALFTAVLGAGLPLVVVGLLGDKNMSTFPGVVAQLLLPSLTLLTGIVSMLLAVASWGDEFEFGTVRTVLSRFPDRWQVVLGKMVALAIATAALILLAVAAELLLAVLSHLVQSGGQDIWRHLVSLAQVFLPLVAVWWLAGMVYNGVVAVATVLGGSPSVGMTAGLGLFIVDLLFGSLGVFGSDLDLRTYLITDNSYGLIVSILGNRFDLETGIMFPSMDVAALPDPGHALTQLLFYVMITLALAYFLFQHKDMT